MRLAVGCLMVADARVDVMLVVGRCWWFCVGGVGGVCCSLLMVVGGVGGGSPRDEPPRSMRCHCLGHLA